MSAVAERASQSQAQSAPPVAAPALAHSHALVRDADRTHDDAPTAGNAVIQLRGLAKRFHVYQRPLDRLLHGVLGGAAARAEVFDAVQPLDLDIHRGETVGIVGRNGSGKSTLLQLIAGTLAPSQGSVAVHGRVAALLELGSGFNPEFTGRENVQLNGVMLGLNTQQVAERFDRIVAFAELAEFIDRPVKTYSSGMYMRLAFAVAIHVDPDVLIVDEALSVGDAAFQRKCFARIEQLKAGGTTILFVSHSHSHVLELCDRAVLMEQGRRLLTASPKRVVELYQKLIYASTNDQPAVLAQIARAEAGGVEEDVSPGSAMRAPAARGSDDADHDAARAAAGDAEQAAEAEHAAACVYQQQCDALERLETLPAPSGAMEYPRYGATISGARILNAREQPVNVLCAGREYRYCYDVDFDRDCRAVRFGMLLKSVTGIELFGTASHAPRESIAHVAAGTRITVAFRFVARLQEGVYFLNAGCASIEDTDHHFLHRLVDALAFRVETPQRRVMAGHVDLSVAPTCALQVRDAASVQAAA